MSAKSVVFTAILSLPLLLGGAPALPAAAAASDHSEFDATLQAPFHADGKGNRLITLHFSYPDSEQTQQVRWRLELLSPRDHVLRRWQGRRRLAGAAVDVVIGWNGAGAGPGPLPAGVYRLRLRAGLAGAGDGGGSAVDVDQSWDVAVGLPRPVASTAARAAAAPAADAGAATAVAPTPFAAAPAYTVHLGNLHSQTGHSDGGGALPACAGAQAPHSAAAGPADAYDYARRRGLDFLMTSEHNHMFDGANGSNAHADPAAAKALYQSGLAAAAASNRAHPGFVALYGQEWGVIDHGGHLNILNSAELLGWERNGAGELLADTATAAGDYASLYALMRLRGWFGQFNHPQGGQFAIDGRPLAWTADGDDVMLLCEVMNSNAFSNRTDESETRHSNYEAGCNRLLEAGYHVAFSSNQDNHCANWGASSGNRTGVLLERGRALGADTLLAALRARRVYATMDKHAELLLTANGRVMGQRFANTGKLTLQVRHTGRRGQRVAAIRVFAGVPGRNGDVAVVGRRARTVLRPAPGEHFYYARVTQDDGKMLWSAPVWVTQRRR